MKKKIWLLLSSFGIMFAVFSWLQESGFIDSVNILQATLHGMKLCVDNISQELSVDRVLVDGTHSPIFKDNDSQEIMCL